MKKKLIIKTDKHLILMLIQEYSALKKVYDIDKPRNLAK